LEQGPVQAHHKAAYRQGAPRANDKAVFKDHAASPPHDEPATNLQNISSNHQLFLLFRDKEEEVKSSCLYAEREVKNHATATQLARSLGSRVAYKNFT